jgi:transcriptional regulator with XRE-family HTH domain
MTFGTRVATLRRQRALTKPALADRIGNHVSPLRRYESGTSQPIIGVLGRLAVALAISADVLIFDETERAIPEGIDHHLKAIGQLGPEEQAAIRALIEDALLRHHARRLASFWR